MRLDRNIPRRMRLDVLDQQGHDLLRHAPFGLQEELALPSDLFGVPLGPLQIGLPLDDDLQLVRPPERLRQRRLLTLGRKANPVEIPAERVRPRSFEKYLESVPLERRSQRPQRVKQRLSARDDDSLRLARSRSPHHLRNIGRRIEFRIPRIFGIAPAAAYVASAQADEIGRFARMESFALNRIEILHQRQFPPSVQQVVIRRFLHRTIRSPRKHPCNSGPTGRSPARIPR